MKQRQDPLKLVMAARGPVLLQQEDEEDELQASVRRDVHAASQGREEEVGGAD